MATAALESFTTCAAMAPSSTSQPAQWLHNPNHTAGSTRIWKYDLILLVLILAFYPLTTFAVFISAFLPRFSKGRKAIVAHPTKRKKILVTGASSSYALALARILHAQGHSIVAADHEPFPFASPARVSRSIKKFYRLSPASKDVSGEIGKTDTQKLKYYEDIKKIVRIVDGIDLWIPCDRNTSQVALKDVGGWGDLLYGAGGVSVFPDKNLANLVSNDLDFAQWVGTLETSIKAPEHRIVESRGEIHRLLHHMASGRRYLLEKMEKPWDDGKQGAEEMVKHDSGMAMSMPSSSSSPMSTPPGLDRSHERMHTTEMLILPQPSMNESYHALADREINYRDRWILREIVPDSDTSISVHALIVDRAVKTFIATAEAPSTSPALYRPKPASTSLFSTSSAVMLSSTSALHATLLSFTTTFAANLTANMATHLTIEFHLHETPTDTGTATVVIPTSCSTVPHPSLALLAVDSASARSIAAAYASVKQPSGHSEHSNGHKDDSKVLTHSNGHKAFSATTPITLPADLLNSSAGLYSLPRIVLSLLLLPLLRLLLLRASFNDVLANLVQLGQTLAYGKEELWSFDYAGVWWWAWCVGFPIEVLFGFLPKGVLVQRAKKD